MGPPGADARGQRIVAVVRPENDASKRVLAKLGLRFRGLEDRYGVQGVELWDVARDDWRR